MLEISDELDNIRANNRGIQRLGGVTWCNYKQGGSFTITHISHVSPASADFQAIMWI